MGLRYVVTGSQGQLGRCLVRLLGPPEAGELAGAFARAELDISDVDAVAARLDALDGGPPDVLVNAAAYTAVDQCESDLETATRVNDEAPGVLAEACRERGTRLLHVSTDYVFDGGQAGEGAHRVDDPTAPRSAYGRTKLGGEQRVLAASPDFAVVRTAWVFGPGKNFVRAVLRQAELRARGEVEGSMRVVADQHGSPTCASDLAFGIRGLVEAGARGVYHLTNAGEATWWDLARAALDLEGYERIEIERIATQDLDLPAPRPLNSRLDCSRAAGLGVTLRHWRDALAAYLDSPDGFAALPHPDGEAA